MLCIFYLYDYNTYTKKATFVFNLPNDQIQEKFITNPELHPTELETNLFFQAKEAATTEAIPTEKTLWDPFHEHVLEQGLTKDCFENTTGEIILVYSGAKYNPQPKNGPNSNNNIGYEWLLDNLVPTKNMGPYHTYTDCFIGKELSIKERDNEIQNRYR